MSSLQNTIEKIKNLEAEKKSLLSEIDELKKMADAKLPRWKLKLLLCGKKLKLLRP